jgi:phage terminase large subunit-like protein
MLFAAEFMAAFDSMAGKELSGEWLKYYDITDIDHLQNPDGSWNLKVYIGVDPAISLADTADRFAITALGVTKDRHQAYLLEQWAGRIPFPEQVDLINLWFQKYRPDFIGIERTAYQAALAQQVSRLEGLPPVVPLWAKGKKHERILSMSPLFRIGKVLVRKDQTDFINEWVDYDSTKSNPSDDCLDSMEITLRTAGVLLPGSVPTQSAPVLEGGASTSDQWSSIANKQFARLNSSDQREVDEHLGEW